MNRICNYNYDIFGMEFYIMSLTLNIKILQCQFVDYKINNFFINLLNICNL